MAGQPEKCCERPTDQLTSHRLAGVSLACLLHVYICDEAGLASLSIDWLPLPWLTACLMHM